MKKIFLAVMMLFALASAASADVKDAIVRVAVTGTDVNLRAAPHPKADAVTKASAPAEYIAARYKSVCAGTGGDGSEWYELLSGERLYISAKFVREIPLRDGDADAVRGYLRRGAEWKPDDAPTGKFADALIRYIGRTTLEAASLHADAAVAKWWDSDDEPGYMPLSAVWTDSLRATYWHDDLLDAAWLAESGAEIMGIVVGRSTEADVREALGAPDIELDIRALPSEAEREADFTLGFIVETFEKETGGFTFTKRDLSGGVATYTEEAAYRIPFKASKMLCCVWDAGDNFGYRSYFYLDDAGRVVAIKTHLL